MLYVTANTAMNAAQSTSLSMQRKSRSSFPSKIVTLHFDSPSRQCAPKIGKGPAARSHSNTTKDKRHDEK